MARPGRKKTPDVLPGPYKETIKCMMRFGTNVDQIAKDLHIKEKTLVEFIREEGIDQDLKRRSWAWKTEKKNRRYRRTMDKRRR